MKKIIIFLILMTAVISKVNSQITFQETFQIAPENYSNTISAVSNGGYIFSTIVQASTFAPSDFNLTSIDSAGTILWCKSYGGSLNDEAYYPLQAADGNIVIAGFYPIGNSGKVLLAKMDLLNGNVLWAKAIGVNGNESAGGPVVETHDKGFAIPGSTWSIGAGNSDFYLVRTDSMGNLLWAKSYGGIDSDNGNAVIETKDHGFIALGITFSFNSPGGDLLVIKTDSLGNIEWSKKYGGSWQEFASSINETPDNGYLISGNTESFGVNAPLLLIKTDSIGTMQWSKVYESFEFGSNAQVTSNSEIIAAGSARDSLNNLLPCIIKTDSLGNIIWNKIYPAGLPAGPFGLALDSGYVQMGNDGFANTLFLVKTDMNGNSGCAEGNIEFTVTNVNITDTSVTLLVDSGGTSTNVTLPSVNVTPFHSICSTTSINENISFASLNEIHISPNPTNDFLTIHYNLSSPQQTTISLFNLYGQKIKTIYNGKQPAGEHEIKTGMKDVAGGVYFVKMDIGGKEEVRKVVKY